MNFNPLYFIGNIVLSCLRRVLRFVLCIPEPDEVVIATDIMNHFILNAKLQREHRKHIEYERFFGLNDPNPDIVFIPIGTEAEPIESDEEEENIFSVYKPVRNPTRKSIRKRRSTKRLSYSRSGNQTSS